MSFNHYLSLPNSSQKINAKPLRDNSFYTSSLFADSPKKVYLMIDNRILDPGNPFIPVKENADLTVSCVVDEGNPKPQLSWELSIAGSPIPEVPIEVLNLTETVHDQKVGARTDARLARVLRAHHNATLTCYVRHIALERPLNVSVLLNVQCK